VEMIRRHHGDVEVRELDREDASGTSSAKARRLIGYAPTRSWRDYLTEDGRLRPEPRDRLARGETGVQRGRAVG
jgi:UDP-glucose 4-epimerase